MTPPPANTLHTVVVWDVPTRLFHWLLVVLVVAAVVTGSQGSSWMPLHGRIGMAILVLVVFRVLWGVFGGTHARFVDFVRGPAQALHHLGLVLRRTPHPEVGHNPLGGYAVVAMLLALGVQAGMGLFSNNDILFFGPLADRLDYDQGLWISSLHRQFAWVVVGLIALHVLAIVLYRILVGLDLVTPMITGRKAVPASHPVPKPGHPLLALGLLALSIALVVGTIQVLRP